MHRAVTLAMRLSSQETLDFLAQLSRSDAVTLIVQQTGVGLYVRLHGLLALTLTSPFEFLILAPKASAEDLDQNEMEYLLRHTAVFCLPLRTLLAMECDFHAPGATRTVTESWPVLEHPTYHFGLLFTAADRSWTIMILDVGAHEPI